MFRLLFFSLMTVFVGEIFASGTEDFDARLFAKYNGSDRLLAQSIVKTSENEGLADLQKILVSAPDQKADEILIALLDHPSTAVVMKVADVLATRKKRVVAEALCKKLDRSNAPVFGGTEQKNDNMAVVARVERALQEILGQEISSDVPLHDRVMRYSKASATLRTPGTMNIWNDW